MTFEPAALLIGLREGLEALLVLGIILGMLHRLDARDRRVLVWTGFAFGILVSLAAGIAVDRWLSGWFEDRGGAALFEVAVALAAVAVLTYMVLWMQRNARAMTTGLKDQVVTAVQDRQAWMLAFLGFITVLREGLEVVLFYSALSNSATWLDILLWGSLGFVVSAGLAYAVFKLTVNVDLRRFFAVSGVLLLLIAAGLLVHAVHAAADLGWIGHGAPMWDTSPVLPDEDHWLGGPLHALVGYEDQPTLLQLVLYVGYLAGVGGYYLSNLRSPDKRRRAQGVAAIVLVALLAGFAIAGAVPTDDTTASVSDHSHGPDGHEEADFMDHGLLTGDAAALLEREDLRVGLLLRSHGEPQHYNASTYSSFKHFIEGIWPYTGLPAELLLVDAGTYYIDDAHPFSTEMHEDAHLVDAWVQDAALPAVPVADPFGVGILDGLSEGTLYFTPGAGPGMGEGDLFEVFGLGTYQTWLKMDNDSPKFDQTEDHFAWMDEHLRKHFGDRVVPAYGYSIDPHTTPDRSMAAAIQKLVDADVDLVLDAYHSSIFSDSMDTCMMQPRVAAMLQQAGFDGPVVPVGMAGTHPAWGQAVVEYLDERIEELPEGTAIHLSHHGSAPDAENPCGGGPDQYNANAAAEFENVKAAIEARFGDRFLVRQVYGQGANDPDDNMLGPMEALDADLADGARKSVFIPFEFWSDSMDNLVPLRESLGFEAEQAPYYDGDHETRFTYQGLAVEVWSAHYGIHEKNTATLARVSQAIVEALS